MNEAHLSKTAIKAHDELIAALGIKNKPNQWLTFMSIVEKHLPLLSASGRPAKAAIQNSLIGQLGYDSWKSMITAKTEDRGLNWNFHTWNAWRKAWVIAKANPYLLKTSITSAELNRLHLETKASDSFPTTKKEYEEYIAHHKELRCKGKTETLNAMRETIATLTTEANEAKATIANLQLMLETTKDTKTTIESELQCIINGLRTQLAEQDEQLKKTNIMVDGQVKRLDVVLSLIEEDSNMSQFDHFKAAIGLDE